MPLKDLDGIVSDRHLYTVPDLVPPCEPSAAKRCAPVNVDQGSSRARHSNEWMMPTMAVATSSGSVTVDRWVPARRSTGQSRSDARSASAAYTGESCM